MTALPTFATATAPSELLTRLDALVLELEARRAGQDNRLGALEGRALPVGVKLGSAGFAFVYSALGAAGWTLAQSKGLAPTSIRADSDGKVAVSVGAAGSRLAIMGYDQVGNVSGGFGAHWRIGMFDVTALGAVNAGPSNTFFSNLNAAYPGDSGAAHGIVDISAGSGTQFRATVQSWTTQGNATGFQTITLATASYDTTANTLSVSVDRNDSQTGAVSGPVLQPMNGSFHRRRAHLLGTASILVPRTRLAYPVASGSSNWDAAFSLYDRIPGSNYAVHGTLGCEHNTVASFAIDRISDRFFAFLGDGYQPGAPSGTAGRLTIFSGDDASRGTLAGGCRLDNPLAGGARVCCLSATLIVPGYTTASQFSTYAVVRNPADNTMRKVGQPSNQGNLGVVPVETLAFNATKLAVLTKGTGWLAQITTYAIDAAAQDGASAFTQVAQTAPFALGAGLAGATPTDNVIVAAVERLGPDRLLIVCRNVTRNLVGVEVFDLT